MEFNEIGEIGFGRSYVVGTDQGSQLKIDLYYTDDFIRPVHISDGIRMASEEDILAMKMNMIGQGARQKDFWDVHELRSDYSIEEMISLYHEWQPHGYSEAELRAGLINFDLADNDFSPICLKGKFWELIKLDFLEMKAGGI